MKVAEKEGELKRVRLLRIGRVDRRPIFELWKDHVINQQKDTKVIKAIQRIDAALARRNPNLQVTVDESILLAYSIRKAYEVNKVNKKSGVFIEWYNNLKDFAVVNGVDTLPAFVDDEANVGKLVGTAITDFRNTLSCSQRAFAGVLGWSNQTISDAERAVKEVTTRKVRHICLSYRARFTIDGVGALGFNNNGKIPPKRKFTDDTDLSLLIGQCIKELRSNLGLSQGQFASRLGWHTQTISDIERSAKGTVLGIKKLRHVCITFAKCFSINNKGEVQFY